MTALDPTTELQRRLCALGYPVVVDGDFGPVTEAAAGDLVTALGMSSLLHPAHMLAALRDVEHVPYPPIPPVTREDRDAAWAFWGEHGLFADDEHDEDIRARFAGLYATLRKNPQDTPDHAVAEVGWWLASQRITETPGRQNRGPWVDRLIRIGSRGTKDPVSAPPWCAYSGGAKRVIAEWATADLHNWPKFRTSGGAVRTWQKARELGQALRADEIAIIDNRWCLLDGTPIDVTGALFARLRTSLSGSEIQHTLDRVWDGGGSQGHAGSVLSPRPTGALLCVAGNSSGSGHSRGRGGRETYEVIDPRADGDVHGYAAYRRLVGLSWVQR